MINRLKTVIVFSVLTLLLIFLGAWFGSTKGTIWALSLASAANFILYFFSDKVLLARYWAFEATRSRYPHVYEIVGRLSAKMGIPPPKIYWINTQSPNAFAVGRSPKHASIAVTDGIVWLLTKEELEGVLGHELGHICNYDVMAKSIAATLAGAFTLLLLMPIRLFLFLYVWKSDDWSAINRYLRAVGAPVAAVLIRLWVSPNSEY